MLQRKDNPALFPRLGTMQERCSLTDPFLLKCKFVQNVHLVLKGNV